MEIHIKYTNIQPNQDLKSYIGQRLGFLDKLAVPAHFGKKELGETVHAWVEIGKVTRHHRQGLVWYAECNIRWPGKNLRATSTNYDLGAAIDEVKDDIELILRKTKEKKMEFIRRKKKIG